ncbi:HAD family hydrolase [Pusillimonas sp. SM2304]|uniref:D-glycero-alpha-D-manno-heptose-1,7-bisphosphate 7-phosphatase n=1 Tax=Pusillimonas sp. SM2304 TaxID=3073241 RepID=UPI002876643A|nr:HAD family hydrolase [Pusillimonas sp. SM2304]MDS1139720.1 HAD family hydrolase [Pusillimonas sp. SM2304]
MALRPAVFLDKDGTVLQDVPYNADPVKMVFAPGARQGISRLAQLNMPIIIVSNQPGIALGKFGFDELCGMQQRLRQMFLALGARLAGFYFCPHHPDGLLPAYARVCDCRKPAPGLLLLAAERHHIDLSRSWFVGDILNDIEAGRRAGCQTVLIDNGNETEWMMNEWRTPDYRLPDLDAASHLLAARQLQIEEGLP